MRKPSLLVACILSTLVTSCVSSQGAPVVAPGHPAVAPAAATGATTPAESDFWEELLVGNDRFVAGTSKLRNFAARRAELATEQHPRAIILTCSDSRVSPELLFDTSLGDIFVIRTAGNVADEVAIGSIEYAVEHLHVHTLVVLGHSRCGAVAAAQSGAVMPSKGLRAIVDRIAPAVTNLTLAAPGDTCEAISANVHQSAEDLLRESPILAHAAASELRIVEATYDLATGVVTTIR